MRAWALADAAVDLPWLSPSASSLVALVQSPPATVWHELRRDPGAVLLLARQPGWDGPRPAFSAEYLRTPGLLRDALFHLQQPGILNWHHPALQSVYQTGVRQAWLAHRLAGLLNECDPDCAWMAGLLAPLGWMAAGAVLPDAVAGCLNHADFPARADVIQEQSWGLDQAAIARRLCRRWRLPTWLGTIIGHLGLPVAIARTLGVDAVLFQVVQLAVGLIQEAGQGLGLSLGAPPDWLISALGLSPDDVETALANVLQDGGQPTTFSDSQLLSQVPLLADLLRLAVEQRSGDSSTIHESLQQDLDRLQRALAEQCSGERERLEQLKLSALAEMAAGAGHEINNPLAVISGQAQYLLSHEADPVRCKSLQTIVGQAQRIHQILNDLMHFARPSPAQLQAIEAGELVQEVAELLHEWAEPLQVRLESQVPASLPGRLYADRKQAQRILSCLWRNAIEAAPAQGWAAVRVELPADGWLELIVEDNGPGPTPAALAHIFDPFYSGRSAGRGRGLGLPTAWRLAQQNGGDVRFAGHHQGVTRFVCRLPFISLPRANGDGTYIPELGLVH